MMRPITMGLLTVATVAGAQSTTLTLDEALATARANNPTYLQAQNARTRATAGLRAAYGAFLPGADASLGSGLRQGRQQFFGGVAFGATSDVMSSNWGLNFSARYSAATVYNLKRAKASVDAAESDISAAEQRLRNDVTQIFLASMQAKARATLQDTLLASAKAQLDLAEARFKVGSATDLDVKRAQVQVGQAEVGVVRERNSAALAMVQLYQQMGVTRTTDASLSMNLPATAAEFSLNQLLDQAKKNNPRLQATIAREQQANANVRSSQGDFIPTMSANASFGGFTNRQKDENALVTSAERSVNSQRASCLSTDSLRRGAGLSGITGVCNSIQFTDAQRSSIIAGNQNWPFNFTSNPYNINVNFSLPLFDGFSRLQRLQESRAGQRDARQAVRAQELQVGADVTGALLTLQNSWKALQIQTANAGVAREALTLADERYRVGAAAFIDVIQARADYGRAETDRINALYEYHRAFAGLEASVGRPLR
ncbi:MAG: TolC family protein [Gemmatimonadaceae bacterium]|nr:TolC family protein [Gemmatimonadaceae bacterium]